jgi:hypothetical protein
MMINQRMNAILFSVLMMTIICFLSADGFSMIPRRTTTAAATTTTRTAAASSKLVLAARNNNNNRQAQQQQVPPRINKMTNERRKKLGVNDDEDEYDLEMALNNNTDPIITKIIAGSLIVSIMALLIYGIVIPATTDYGEGVCNPLLTGGRC